MNRFSPFYAGALVVAFIVPLACSNDPSPVSSASPTPAATFIPNGTQSIVVQSDDYDVNMDGIVERLIVTTTRYDVHGNALEVEVESFAQSARVYHETTSNEYNQHGDVIGFVNEYYDRGSDVVTIRYIMSTIEADKQGHPLRQKIAEDLEADGTFEYSFEQSNQFDSRGRLITWDTGQQTAHYQYDQHDNVARFDMHVVVNHQIIDEILTAAWTVHGCELRSASTVTQTGQPERGHTLAAASFDPQGYPIVQILERTRGGQLSSHATVENSYDGHHRLLSRVFSDDTNLDGRPDYRLTSRYDYRGPDVPTTHGVAGVQSAGLTGPALSRGMDKRGPDGPIGGRFSR